MIKDLIFVFWFFGPAGLATVAALVAGRSKLLKKFSYPADFYFKFRGKRVLGDHKTIRGFVVGVFTAVFFVSLQAPIMQIFPGFRKLIPLDYNSINPAILGFLLGFGAMFGDAVKSFFKRQIGAAPGKSWFPFDQIDYILGGILFTSFYIRLSLWEYTLLFLVWFLIHPLSTLIGYIVKLKDSPL